MPGNVGWSSARIRAMLPPQTSQHARMWARTSFGDHSPWAGAVCSRSAGRPSVSIATRDAFSRSRASASAGVSDGSSTARPPRQRRNGTAYRRELVTRPARSYGLWRLEWVGRRLAWTTGRSLDIAGEERAVPRDDRGFERVAPRPG